MKRLGVLLFVLVLGYIFYYDIKIGTLPMLSSYKKTTAAETIKKENTDANQNKEKETEKETDTAYKAIEVKTGDTVLSITEAINKKKIPSIEKIINDFKQLNKNTSATKIQVGKSYKFPLYQ